MFFSDIQKKIPEHTGSKQFVLVSSGDLLKSHPGDAKIEESWEDLNSHPVKAKQRPACLSKPRKRRDQRLGFLFFFHQKTICFKDFESKAQRS